MTQLNKEVIAAAEPPIMAFSFEYDE